MIQGAPETSYQTTDEKRRDKEMVGSERGVRITSLALTIDILTTQTAWLAAIGYGLWWLID
jgi:hypothetical protein